MEPLREQKPQSPEAIPQIFVKAWNDRDTYEIIDLFEESAELINVESLWQHKNKEIYSAYESGIRFNFKEVRLSLKTVEVKYITKTIAEVKAEIQIQKAKAGAATQQNRKLLFTFVAQQTGEEWLCIALNTQGIG